MGCMRKVLLWLGLVGGVLLVVVVALALVRAPFDPARMIKHKFFPSKDMMYEARLQMTLAQSMSDVETEKWLKKENELLHSEDFLRPLVKELGLVAEWKLPGEKEAVATLRERCELRRGELPMNVELAARDKQKDLTGRLMKALSEAYMAKRQQPALRDDGFNGGL